MKGKNLLLGIMLAGFVGSMATLSFIGHHPEKKYHPRITIGENEIKGAIDWLASIRNNKETGTIDIADVLNARKEISLLNNAKSLGINWNELGPNNVGGRTRAILVDKDNHTLLYAGGVSGGLWKSATGGTSWQMVSSFPDLNIACIAQSPITGNLYVGTGESYANVGYVGGTPGFVGSGLYESTDDGLTWHIFNGATPTAPNLTNDPWSFVNRIAIDPFNDRVYAASNKGLLYWDPGSASWINPVYGPTNNLVTQEARTVVVSSNRAVAAQLGSVIYISPAGGNGEPHTFVNESPVTGMSRTELAFAPSNPNYLYACAANSAGALKGVYRTTDQGQTWTNIGPGGAPAFELFGGNNQGSYDNTIAVFPNNADRVLVGGLCLWEWNYGGNFTQKTAGYEVHVDLHNITFEPGNDLVYYIGGDGGIAKTLNGGQTYNHINKNYNVTQFYAVALSNKGAVMGGTQDNSNPYVSRTTFDSLRGELLYGGDGGWAAFSNISPNTFFGTMQYGNVWRSPDKGVTYQDAINDQFLSASIIGSGSPGQSGSFARFVTPLLVWESFNEIYSPDSVTFVVPEDSNYLAGRLIEVHSHNNNAIFFYTLTTNLSGGDSIRIQDIISSRYFVALASGIWMTRGALDFSKTPQWYKVSSVTNAHTMSISKDGNYLFIGTDGGILYRLSNLNFAIDSLSATITSDYCVLEQKNIKSFGPQSVTSIGIDPNDPDRVVVTLGNYGYSNYVHYSSNALASTVTFTSKQGSTSGQKLPAMPVYSCIIEQSNPNRVILGTEYGIFATEDITQTAVNIVWTEENDGMSRVPVFMMRQQIFDHPGVTNYGNIYIGTHGRGFFESKNYYNSLPETGNSQAKARSPLNIYPNPLSDHANLEFIIEASAKVQVFIYDLSGKIVKSDDLNTMAQGAHTASIDVSSLSRGTYIVQLVYGNQNKSAKLIVTR